jgi:phospholipid transport system transporter-binding protein
MNAATLQVSSANEAMLSGDLTFKTVRALAMQAATLLGPGKNISQLDLSEVKKVDSSGLALLLEWQASANKCGASLQVVHAPEDLISLAKLCEAEELLQLRSRKSNDLSD